jgi:hypothetical protein
MWVFTLSTARAWKNSPKHAQEEVLQETKAGTPIDVSSLLTFCNILLHTHGDFILRTWCEGQ